MRHRMSFEHKISICCLNNVAGGEAHSAETRESEHYTQFCNKRTGKGDKACGSTPVSSILPSSPWKPSDTYKQICYLVSRPSRIKHAQVLQPVLKDRGSSPLTIHVPLLHEAG